MSSENTLATTEPRPQKIAVSATSRGIQFTSMDEMARFCQAVATGGEFKDIRTPEQALIRLQAGLELGLSPVWSLTNIFVVNSKPTVYGDALLGIVQAHPSFEDIIEEFKDETATCTVKRKGRSATVRSFSVTDAKKAGLWGKAGPWSQYPSRMLQMRARSFACRDAFADALRGLGVHEEQEDVPKPVKARIVADYDVPEDAAPVEVPAPFQLEEGKE